MFKCIYFSIWEWIFIFFYVLILVLEVYKNLGVRVDILLWCIVYWVCVNKYIEEIIFDYIGKMVIIVKVEYFFLYVNDI